MDYDLNCTMLGELLEFEVEVDVFFHQNVDGHILYGSHRLLEYDVIA